MSKFVIPLSIMFSLYTHMLVHIRENTKNTQRIKLMEMGDVKIKVEETIVKEDFFGSIHILQYQPSGARGTHTPPATPHHLQNPKWPPGGSKMTFLI